MPRRRPAIALRAGCIRPAPGKAIRLQHSHSVVRKRRRCRSMKDQYGVAEIESVLPCQDCGCHAVFMAAVASGKRPKLPYLRCCQCGRVRRDLRDTALLIDVNRISHLATAGQSGREPIWPEQACEMGDYTAKQIVRTAASHQVLRVKAGQTISVRDVYACSRCESCSISAMAPGSSETEPIRIEESL
jgi:hypothetical protein